MCLFLFVSTSMKITITFLRFLPPAYVVRREGNSFTLFVCPHLGGYPYPIMLCNISQNAMRQWGGIRVPPWGGTQSGTPGTRSGTPPGGSGYPPGGPGTPPGGRVPPWGGTRSGGGGTRSGQQKEYSLHGGRYASCVHAGGLSC